MIDLWAVELSHTPFTMPVPELLPPLKKLFDIKKSKCKSLLQSNLIFSFPGFKEGKPTDMGHLEAAYCSGGITGLQNLGNTCYINCVMQCLSHTLELTDIFLTNQFNSSLCSGMSAKLACTVKTGVLEV